MYVNDNNVIYYDNFGVEHIPKEIKQLIGDRNITINIYRMQVYDLTMCEYFRSGFIDFMLKGESLFGYKNLFSCNYYE